MELICTEIMLNKKLTINTKEADEFRKAFQKDVEFAKSKGWTIELPF